MYHHGFTPDRVAADMLERGRPGAGRLAGLFVHERQELAELERDEKRLADLKQQLERTSDRFARRRLEVEIDGIEMGLKARQRETAHATRMFSKLGVAL